MNSTEQRTIKIQDQTVSYLLRRSTKAKHIRISIYNNAELILTLPFKASVAQGEYFIQQKGLWILQKLKHKKETLKTSSDSRSVDELKKDTLHLVLKRLTHFNQFYNFKYNRVAIRKQKTRWGSCSRNGNLSFNYKIALLPEECADYIVVHELCHLKEFNHSERFWKLVEKTVPDWKAIKKQIRELSLA